ncbi:MAG: hypothetical protein ABSD38_33390 [Syntrophorhabdales bacterium]|jgi:hypothetical protein
MDLAQVAEMKNKIIEELQQIEALKRSMKDTLARLKEWEKRLRRSTANPVKTATGRRAVVKERRAETQWAIKPSRLTTTENINKALTTIRGEFTRSQLLREAERYGERAIGVGSFRSVFSELVRTRHIRCVAGRPTERDSLYVRSEEE